MTPVLRPVLRKLRAGGPVLAAAVLAAALLPAAPASAMDCGTCPGDMAESQGECDAPCCPGVPDGAPASAAGCLCVALAHSPAVAPAHGDLPTTQAAVIAPRPSTGRAHPAPAGDTVFRPPRSSARA